MTRLARFPRFLGSLGLLASLGLVSLGACEAVSTNSDQDAPDTIITSQHNATSVFAHLEVAFTSSEPGSTFQCSLDGGEFEACSSPHAINDLANGPHAFAVRAIDEAGNADQTPAELAWTVDTDGAAVEFLAQPAQQTNTRVAQLEFATNHPATFLCYLDDELVACPPNADGLGGSFTSASLADGDHAFRVDATLTGTGEEVTNTATWMLDATGPVVVFLSPTNNGGTNATAIEVEYSVNEAATLTCTRNGASAPCGTFAALPATITADLGNLSTGSVTYRVVAEDALGNVSTNNLNFVVDRTKPTVTFNAETSNTVPFSANEAVTFRCTITQLPSDVLTSNIVCNTATPPGTTGVISKNYSSGQSYSVEVTATDVSGNTSTPVTKTFCSPGFHVIPCNEQQ